MSEGIRGCPKRQECNMHWKGGHSENKTPFSVDTWGLGDSYMPILLSHRSSDSDTWPLMAHGTSSSIHGACQLYPQEVLLDFYGLFSSRGNVGFICLNSVLSLPVCSWCCLYWLSETFVIYLKKKRSSKIQLLFCLIWLQRCKMEPGVIEVYITKYLLELLLHSQILWGSPRGQINL